MEQSFSGPAILVEGLKKSFGDVHALRGIDLSVPRGTVLGVLGPNGAGQTTAVRILTTLLRPDGGRALVEGHDVVREPSAVRRSIGQAGQTAALQIDTSGCAARSFATPSGAASRHTKRSSPAPRFVSRSMAAMAELAVASSSSSSA